MDLAGYFSLTWFCIEPVFPQLQHVIFWLSMCLLLFLSVSCFTEYFIGYFPTLYTLFSTAISELPLAALSIFISLCYNCLRHHNFFKATCLILLSLNPVNIWSLIAMSSAVHCFWSHLKWQHIASFCTLKMMEMFHRCVL